MARPRKIEPNPSVIVFPVRSNAKSLVTGSPLASVRRRLKLASVLYDSVLLEGGQAIIQAGPTGGSCMWHPSQPDEEVRWQSPSARSAGQRSSFQILMGAEATPGVPSNKMVPVVSSESSISWWATLEPFRNELPRDCDWVEWVYAPDPQGASRKVYKEWVRLDLRNDALQRALPEQFVRSRAC